MFLCDYNCVGTDALITRLNSNSIVVVARTAKSRVRGVLPLATSTGWYNIKRSKGDGLLFSLRLNNPKLFCKYHKHT